MKKRAFTLVELLVVIGIIAVLIAVLLPVLRTAREHAVNVQCLSNLRSCGQILYIYASQNKGYFPQMALQSPETLPLGNQITGADVPPSAAGQLWYSNVREALARIANPSSNPDSQNPAAFSPGGIKVFYCPGNWFWEGDTPGVTGPGLSHWPEDYLAQRGRIGYWYYGNPNPWYPNYHYRGPFGTAGSPGGVTFPSAPPAGPPGGVLDWRFWDTNLNGTNRDEYIVKLGDKNMSNNVLMSDHSRQASFAANTVGFQFVHGKAKNWRNGWKNNLYGDGSAGSRRARPSSFSPDGTAFTNTNPGRDELQPRWGNAGAYQMY